MSAFLMNLKIMMLDFMSLMHIINKYISELC